MTQEEALADALRNDEAEYGHGEGYGGGRRSLTEVLKVKQTKVPKPATKVTVTKAKATQPAKKVFRIETRWHARGDAVSSDRAFQMSYASVTDATTAGKLLALKYQVDLVVVQALSGTDRLVTIEPEKGQIGVWDFVCEFRE
jgi:hypothetical protein